MTHLRKMMLEELQRRNYSENTIRSYIRTVEDFARRFNCPPDRLGPQHIRQYQAELFQKRKLSSGTVVICLAALRFFYTKTLRRHWSIADTPYPKKAHRLPTILSQEEVAQLIDAASTPFHRTLLMTLYATGARNQEVTHLKFRDVDSKVSVRPVHLDRFRIFANVSTGSVCFRSPCSLGLGYLNHAEEVAVGIFQDDKVIARFISPRITGRPDLDQPLHIALSVVCVEIEVQSTSLA
jgi:hypothetical protein